MCQAGSSRRPRSFFCMLRRPPTSTLFPYRRSSDLSPKKEHPWQDPSDGGFAALCTCRSPAAQSIPPERSEEHTSELQSRPHLVCRLLLEKKKDIPVLDTRRGHPAGGPVATGDVIWK